MDSRLQVVYFSLESFFKSKLYGRYERLELSV